MLNKHYSNRLVVTITKAYKQIFFGTYIVDYEKCSTKKIYIFPLKTIKLRNRFFCGTVL